jgi:deoxyadenosine/deoxycytidine kinase
MPRRFIAIEGLIGVGKTSLCRLLSQEWGARLVLEPWEHNPFLAAFYEDRERYAFPAQMFYLASRSAQQLSLRQADLFDELIIADYLFQKDRLFAEETLAGAEMELYDRFARMLCTSAPRPDFVLFLDAPTEVIMSRISKRGISSEQVIEADYLNSLRQRYYALWDRYSDAPVYILDTSTIDYTSTTDDSGREYMKKLIQGWLNGKPIHGAPRPYKAPSGAAQMNLFQE